MRTTKAWVEEAVRSLSPRRRAWNRLLSGLMIDPDVLPKPIEPPPDRDFIVCGASRTGTSLLSAILYQPPRVVTVMEPWDGMRLTPADLFRSLRDEIESSGELSRGRLNVEALLTEGRVVWGRDGEHPATVAVEKDYVLGVKWPAFWRYLELLPDTKFLICLRHPVEVVASFEKTGGRLAEGLDYDIPFNRRMNEELARIEADPLVRRILLYEYVNSRLLPYLSKPNVFTVRYERWFEDPSVLLEELSEFLGTDVRRPHCRIRRPSSSSAASNQQPDLIRRLAPSAATLGYEFP